MTAFLCALGGYLAGSIPFAVLVSRAMGLPDPRSYGSGNIGATNVLRSGSRAAALLTLAGDAAKGWAAVLVARALGLDAAMLAITGVAAFAGHVFPVWLRFRGGKGVATGAGVLIALDWRLGLAVLAAWLAVVAITRYSSLAAIVAALAAPAAAWWLDGPGPILAAVAAMAALIVLRHRANIAKLARGEESRIGEKKAARPPP
ncbi:MAG TPA: glycerol-3-phosphate 1-O-acyltransferase PlsY [Usitatibacter sp.]|nr:glycerol-3-phosphate 1-O-acyltransferase PlsY [Usitatibacter sp.]